MKGTQTATRLEWRLSPWQRPDGRWGIGGTVTADQPDGHRYTYLHCDSVFPFATEAQAQGFIDDLRATYGDTVEASG